MLFDVCGDMDRLNVLERAYVSFLAPGEELKKRLLISKASIPIPNGDNKKFDKPTGSRPARVKNNRGKKF